MKKVILAMICSLGFSLISQATVHTVLVGQGGGFTFSPSTLSVSVNDTVRFNWVSGSHTTTSLVIPSGADTWSSTMSNNVTSFDYIVKKEGTYNYQCNPHGGGGMKGSFTATITGLDAKFEAIKSSFVLAPNPVKNTANLTFTSEKSFKGFVRVFDANGIMILEESLKVETGENSFSINTEKLSAGMYYVNLFDKNNSFMFSKMLKQ